MRWIFVLFLVACGSPDAPSKEDCRKVTDHLIDLLATPRSSDKDSQQAAEAWKKQLKERDPSRQNLMEMCTKSMKADHVTCVMDAKDEAAVAKCLGG